MVLQWLKKCIDSNWTTVFSFLHNKTITYKIKSTALIVHIFQLTARTQVAQVMGSAFPELVFAGKVPKQLWISLYYCFFRKGWRGGNCEQMDDNEKQVIVFISYNLSTFQLQFVCPRKKKYCHNMLFMGLKGISLALKILLCSWNEFIWLLQ